ncbi:hypothetical protein FDH01_gp187 [Acinetobacter phage vB_AbaM_ME3]|uniref:Uncharacterized protein n=1 Tax=Acinetobacter phage vB_AbaM_ME3 TaxID=1837876 RepID=A0A172Q0S2_9CAUD|nr:hypothetical protein FDH01_gp187 [Acinetobacter phage vB_AbaM_ME3]AND75435.1 hypothetical protein ME3_274 [Acinetobacter phage vB_AbaM_ME3]
MIEALDDRLTIAEGSLTSTNTIATTTRDRLTDVSLELDELKTNTETELSVIADSVAAVDTKATSSTALIENLTISVTAIEGRIITTNSSFNNFKNDTTTNLSALQDSITAVNGKIDSYKSSNDLTMSTVQADLANHKTSTTSSLDTLNSELDQFKTETNSSIAANSSAITTTQSQVTNLTNIVSTKADASVLSDYATKEDLNSVTIDTSSLEKIASKATIIDSTSIADTTKYPTVKAVSDYVTTEISKIPTGGGSGSVGVEPLPYTVDGKSTNLILGTNDQLLEGTLNKGVITSKTLTGGVPEATYIPNVNIPFTSKFGFVASSKAVSVVFSETQVTSPIDIVPLIGTTSNYDEIITVSKGTGTVDVSVVKLSTGAPVYSFSRPNYANEFIYLEIKNNKLSIYLEDTIVATDAYTFEYQFTDNTYFVSVGAVMNGANLYAQTIPFDLSKRNTSTITINSVDGVFYTVPVDLTILSQTVKANSVISFYDNGTKFIYIDRVPEQSTTNPEIPDVVSQVIPINSSDLQESFTTGNAFQVSSYTTATYDSGTDTTTVLDNPNILPMQGLCASQPISNKSVLNIGLLETKPLVLSLSNDASLDTIYINNPSSLPSPVLIFTHEEGDFGGKKIKIQFAFNNLYNIIDVAQFNWYQGTNTDPTVTLYFDKDVGKVYFLPDYDFNNEVLGFLDLSDYLGYLKPANLYVNLQDLSVNNSYISATSFKYAVKPAMRIKKPVGANFKTYYKIIGSFPNWSKFELNNPIILEDNDLIVFVDEDTSDFVVYRDKDYNVANYTLNDLDTSRYNPVNSNAVSSFVTNKVEALSNSLDSKAYVGFKPYNNYLPSLHSDDNTNAWKLVPTSDIGNITVPIIYGYAPPATYRYGRKLTISEDYTTFTVNAIQGSFAIVIGGTTVSVDGRNQFRISEIPGVTYSFDLQLGFLVRKISESEYTFTVTSNRYPDGLNVTKTGSWDGSIFFTFTPNMQSETKLSLQDTLNVSFDTSNFNSYSKIRHTDTSFKPWLAKSGDMINVTVDGLEIDGSIYNTGDVVEVLTSDQNNLNYKYSLLNKPIQKWISMVNIGDPQSGVTYENCLLEFANLDGYLWVRGKLKLPVSLTAGQSVFRILSPIYKGTSDYTPAKLGSVELNYGSGLESNVRLVSYLSPTDHDLVINSAWDGSYTDWIYINPTAIAKIA